MKKRILITGATGYLGSNIVNTLKTEYDFVILKRVSSDTKRIINIVDFEVYNIEDLDIKLISKLQIDTLLHCATHYGRKDIDSVSTIESNLLLPLKLLSLFKQAKLNVNFINTDTILDKNVNVYSLSKSHFKEWMVFFSHDIVFVNIKLEHFYGPLDDRTKFVSYLIDCFIKESSHIDLTAGEQKRYFTYIDDIVTAFNIIIKNLDKFPKTLTEFHVSSDKSIVLKDFVYLVQKITGNAGTKLNWGVLKYRENELMDFSVDTSAIKKLGWLPVVTLTDGLNKTFSIDKSKV